MELECGRRPGKGGGSNPHEEIWALAGAAGSVGLGRIEAGNHHKWVACNHGGGVGRRSGAGELVGTGGRDLCGDLGVTG